MSPEPSYASCLFFSAAASTFIKSRGTAFSTVTSCTIGACMRAEQPRVELGLARQRRELGDLGRLDRAALHHRRLDRQRRRGLDERRQRLGERDRIVRRVGDRRRALEELLERLERRALERALGERVLDDLVARLGGAELAPQLGDLRDVQPLVVDEDRAVGSLERRLSCCSSASLSALVTAISVSPPRRCASCRSGSPGPSSTTA